MSLSSAPLKIFRCLINDNIPQGYSGEYIFLSFIHLKANYKERVRTRKVNSGDIKN